MIKQRSKVAGSWELGIRSRERKIKLTAIDDDYLTIQVDIAP